MCVCVCVWVACVRVREKLSLLLTQQNEVKIDLSCTCMFITLSVCLSVCLSVSSLSVCYVCFCLNFYLRGRESDPSGCRASGLLPFYVVLLATPLVRRLGPLWRLRISSGPPHCPVYASSRLFCQHRKHTSNNARGALCFGITRILDHSLCLFTYADKLVAQLSDCASFTSQAYSRMR